MQVIVHRLEQLPMGEFHGRMSMARHCVQWRYNELRPAFFAFRHRAFIAAAMRALPSALMPPFRLRPGAFGAGAGLATTAAPRMALSLCSRASIRSRNASARRSVFADAETSGFAFMLRLRQRSPENQGGFAAAPILKLISSVLTAERRAMVFLLSCRIVIM
jgi:hypothetical protein